MMSNDGLIIEYMDLSHIHLAVKDIISLTLKSYNGRKKKHNQEDNITEILTKL